MKKLLKSFALASSIALACLSFSNSANAQADPKLEWATKVVTLQQGPELDRLVDQLAENAAQDVLQNWAPKVETGVTAERRQRVKEDLNAELKKYFDDVSAIISSKVNKVSADALVPAYMDKFTLDELKQIAAFFESPAIKKYQSLTPELGNIFVKQLVDATRPEVSARANVFNKDAAKLIGTADSKSAPPATKSKAAVKK